MSLQRARVSSSTSRSTRSTSTGRELELRRPAARELAHARHGARHVVDGALDDLQLLARALAEAGLVREQRLHVDAPPARSHC